MKNKGMYYLLLALAILGVLGGLAIGFMNSFKLGWQALAGSSEDKAKLKLLDDAATAIANKDATKKVDITITSV